MEGSLYKNTKKKHQTPSVVIVSHQIASHSWEVIKNLQPTMRPSVRQSVSDVESKPKMNDYDSKELATTAMMSSTTSSNVTMRSCMWFYVPMSASECVRVWTCGSSLTRTHVETFPQFPVVEDAIKKSIHISFISFIIFIRAGIAVYRIVVLLFT